MNVGSPIAVREYLARVRSALADLPVGEVDEILDDVRPHLTEISAELGVQARLSEMVARLGTPESYAAELRAAGDYPAAAPGAGTASAGAGLFGPRVAVWSLALSSVGLALVGFVMGLHRFGDAIGAVFLFAPVLIAGGWYVAHRGIESVRELPEVRRIREALEAGAGGGAAGYLRSLRPAWWLACALILVVVGLLVFPVAGARVLVLFVLAALAALALWAGPRSARDRRWLWAAVPVSAIAAGSAVGLLGAAIDGGGSYAYVGTGSYHGDELPGSTVGPQELNYEGSPITNLYVFDAEGNLLPEVYLYDENGRPVSVPRRSCDGAYGVTLDNRFPRPRVVEDYETESGEPRCDEVDEVPFTVAIPKSTTSSMAPAVTSAPASPAPKDTPKSSVAPTPSR